MNTEQPRFANPWGDDPIFVNLGHHDVWRYGPGEAYKVYRFDLYALEQPSGTIDFGARYSNDGPDYISGSAHQDARGRWTLYVGNETAIAAARYFANHYHNGRQHIMNTDNTYNGWTNYETWNWALWLNNEYDSQRYWSETAQQIVDDIREPEYEWQSLHDAHVDVLASMLKQDCDDRLESEGVSTTGPFADLLGVAISQIDWYEIAASIIDDCEQPDDDDDEDDTTGD